MKRKFLLILFFLLLISNVLAISPPLLPFPFGQEIIIDGQLGPNLIVKIEDKDSDVIRTATNEQGQFLIDLANFGKEYSKEDIFKVTIYRGNEERTYEVIIDKEEGGMFFTKNINWDKKIITDSEGILDVSTMRQLLISQREEITKELKSEFDKKFEKLNAESNEKIKIERWISIRYALALGIFFLILSSIVTRCYAIKYGNKIRKKKRKKLLRRIIQFLAKIAKIF